MKETSPMIPEDDLKSNEYPMQTFPMKASDGEEVDSVIQDYIDQVAATNLKQRRSNFAESDLRELAIPAGGVGLPSPGVRNVRFSPGTPDHHSSHSVASTALENVPEEIAPAIDMSDIENQFKHTLKSEKEFNHAKNLLRLAFVEFYRGLGLLSNYRYYHYFLLLCNGSVHQ